MTSIGSHLLAQELDDHIATEAEAAEIESVPSVRESPVYLFDLHSQQ